MSSNIKEDSMFETKYHNVNLEEYSFLVTGGSGFIGSNIVEYLLLNNARLVRVLDNFLTSSRSNLDSFKPFPNLEIIEGDITDLETCRKACEGIDFITHQAALGSVPRSLKEPYRTNFINVGGFVNMLSAAKDAGVKRFVYASSSSVYGDEPSLPKIESKIGRQLSPYAVSKYTNELYADVFHRAYQMEVIGLRYFNIFGPRQDPNGMYAAVIPIFVDKILKREPVYIDGDGEQTRDFTFVENAVQANIKAMLTSNLEAIGQVYNIACGSNFSVNYLYHQIAQILGSDHPCTYRESRQGDIRNSLADITKAKKLLDYDPKFSFEEGLPITVKSFFSKG
jgi:UDP-N-acetylglucosamine/UDP-N-acetylgalactosamine 4-epimerase